MPTQRPAVPLDGSWEFVPDPERRFTPETLPAGVPIAVPGAWESQLREPYGIVRGWYRRRFTEPTGWGGGTVVLRFGAVMARATVWLDGHLIGEHGDGYLPFELELGAARPGAEHDLVIAVENRVNVLSDYPAFDPDVMRAAIPRLGGQSFESIPHGKQTWYTSTSGLVGTVTAELAPNPRLATLVVLPDLDSGLAVVRWRLAGTGATDRATLSLTVTSPSGQVVVRATADARATATTIAIPRPDVWDLWAPALYQVAVRIGDDSRKGRARDEASVRFGMRSIAVRDGAILLNGRPVYLRGALDQDFWPDGRSNPPSRASLEAQVRLARDMGLNLLRCHLKIPDPNYLDVADEAGLLLWCELPNWSRFDLDAAMTARRMLARMVETMGSHPSIVAWTVINEDWGADLRHEARDRRWLRTTVDWLKATDSTRLVVDNSACEPSFHLRTDLADFHAYRSMPDGLSRWRALVGDFARRPGWLWSPHGDAAPTGHEALVMSEFGSWGLPRPSRARSAENGEPWWWTTGERFRRPAGIQRRFQEQRLGRIWDDVDALADATQWQQFAAFAGQVRELRRHPSIRGYVVTEFTDLFWEANGLLDVNRGPKIFHDRVAELNAPDVLVVDLPRFDLWAGERISCDALISSFSDSLDASADGEGQLIWQIRLAGRVTTGPPVVFGRWPRFDARVVARLELDVPDVTRERGGELIVTATRSSGRARAVYRTPITVIPKACRRSAVPRRIRVVDPVDLWSIAARITELGHQLTTARDAELIVASHLDRGVLAEVDDGATLLLLARSADSIDSGVSLSRSFTVRSRGSQADLPWNGDYSSVFAWALPGIVPGLPDGGLLGDAEAEIYPDHVLDGGNPAAWVDIAGAGLFSGWVHSPAALLAEFAQTRGEVMLTTLRLSPEDGPVATALLEALIQRLAGA